MATKSDVFVATESGSTEVKGETYVYVKNVTRVRAGHPLLKAVPTYFRPVEDRIHYDVEAASAAPGEQRGA